MLDEVAGRINIASRAANAAALLLCAAAAAWAQTAAEHNAAGVAHYNAGEWKLAIQEFEQAYQYAPDNEVVRRNLCNAHQAQANVLAKKADYAAAAKHLEIAISVAPENASPLIQLGFYYLRLDMVADAIYRLEEAIEIDPHNIDGQELLGDAYYKDNDVPSALVHWRWVQEQAPERPGIADKIAKASREEAVEAKFFRSESQHFKLSYPPGASRDALAKVLRILEQAYFEVGRNFGRVFPPSVVQVIVHDSRGFADVTQLGEHVGGLYDGKIRIPLTDAAGNPLSDDELRRRLFHEYTHVVVRFLAANNVPWWLNEGLAETFSRDFGDHQRRILEKAQADGALFALSELEGSQLGRLDVTALRLAYCQSHACVELLWSRYGQRPLRTLMSALAEGTKPEDALVQCYRMNYKLLEQEMKAHYASLGR